MIMPTKCNECLKNQTKTNKIKEEYTSEELKILDEITDELVIWMFSRPNDRFVILTQLKRAYQLGKLK